MRFPWDTFPGVWHRVFAFVTAEGDAHVWVVTVGERPFADVGADIMVLGVTTFAQVMGVGRIQEDGGCADVGGDAGCQDAFPITATDTDTTETGGQGTHIIVQATGCGFKS